MTFTTYREDEITIGKVITKGLRIKKHLVLHKIWDDIG